ncbi:MAG: 16S rRNA (guanine(527)-N(7))-methyltransferase RsmG [Candidatus Saganbacteria bacterium]|nr:16S rRNA (guanine(527)-N(7))-methyltransferase RsmG [Candidatus Saganbacteria bacterium]
MDKEARFKIYSKELINWNKKFNLTSITDEDDIILKHFKDCETLKEAFDFSTGHPEVIDIGTGAGFPGLVLKVLFPDIKLTLLDCIKKKTGFLSHIADILGFKDIDIIWERAEDYAKKRREQYDVAVCRALAPLNIASELCLPFVKTGGIFIAMKGKDIETEIKNAEKALKIMGGKLERTIQVELDDEKNRKKYLHQIVVIKKEKLTPEKYPRKPGICKKRPL